MMHGMMNALSQVDASYSAVIRTFAQRCVFSAESPEEC